MQIELYILGVMIICLTFTDLDFSQKYVCTFLKPVVLIIIKSVPTYVHIFGKVTYSRICLWRENYIIT